MDALPKPAPADPLPLAERWLGEASTAVPKNPWAMALASAKPDGVPSVRYVLLKSLDIAGGFIVFYTNYGSRKAAELEATHRAAGALYWPDAGRQLRLEGRIERSPATESDEYFASRPRLSQLNAWASDQSQPLASPDLMDARLNGRTAEFGPGDAIPRPPHWGGYRLHLEAIEFWVEGTNRFHERLCYTRSGSGPWSAHWLQP